MILLDSDTLTYLIQGRRISMVQRLEQARIRETVALPIFVRAETLRGQFDGLLKAGTPEQIYRMQDYLTQMESYFTQFPIVPFDEGAGEHFDRLIRNKKLKKTGLADFLIACISLSHDATLVTCNTKHYQAIPNLKLDNWAK